MDTFEIRDRRVAKDQDPVYQRWRNDDGILQGYGRLTEEEKAALAGKQAVEYFSVTQARPFYPDPIDWADMEYRLGHERGTTGVGEAIPYGFPG